MKKIITWIITILGFLWFILSIIFLVNIPMLHKEVKENLYINMAAYENEYKTGVETTVRYDFPYRGYDIQELHIRITFYLETGEAVHKDTVLLRKNHKVEVRRYDINNFAHQSLPVKVVIEDVEIDIDKRPYIIAMVVGLVFGIIGLWKIIFAPLKEKWY
jgi:hypothetical protein